MAVSTQYAALLREQKPRSVRFLYHFLRQVYRVGKLTELISFLVWECRHRLKLYRRGMYLLFDPAEALQLDETGRLVMDSTSGNSHSRGALAVKPVRTDWKYCFVTNRNEWWGCTVSADNTLLYSADGGRHVIRKCTFTTPIQSLFVTTDGVIFVSSGGQVHRSDDAGATFIAVITFSSAISWFLFNNGMTELPDGGLLVGEYGSI